MGQQSHINIEYLQRERIINGNFMGPLKRRNEGKKLGLYKKIALRLATSCAIFSGVSS